MAEPVNLKSNEALSTEASGTFEGSFASKVYEPMP
jgi:hypothetical protein